MYLDRRGTLPWFEDLFPAYGGPWWYRLDIGTFQIVLVAFLVVTLATSATGWLMWRGSRRAAIASLALIPVEAVFWVGFALPIPWLVGAARVILIIVALPTLRRAY
jgi:hypothetical protein